MTTPFGSPRFAPDDDNTTCARSRIPDRRSEDLFVGVRVEGLISGHPDDGDRDGCLGAYW